jgi:O-antigen ligase
VSSSGESPSPKGSSFALVVLVGLAILTPWPFGSVTPWAVHLLTLVALATCAISLSWSSMADDMRLPALPFRPLLGLLALGLLQLVPLPAALHGALAPGSHEVWSPASSAARAVLGGGPHPVSVHPTATVQALLLGAGLCGLAVLAAPALAQGTAAIRSVTAVVAGAVAVAVYGIFAGARFGSLLYGHIPVPTLTPFGPFVSKNHFAGYVGMATLLALGLAAGLGSGAARRANGPPASFVAAVVAALAMALGVLVSLSRAGAISLALGVLAFAALRLRHRLGAGRAISVVPSLLTAGVLFSLLLLALPPRSHERLRSLGGASFRLDTWRDTLRAAAASPWVGHGLGSFADAYPRFKRGHGALRVEHAENEYLEVFAETGLAGLGLAMAALLLLAARALAWRPSSLLRGLGAGALGGLVVLLVHSAFDFNLRVPSNAVLAALLASVVAAGAPPRRVPAWAGRAGAAGFAVAALLVLGRSVPIDTSTPWQRARNEARRTAASVAPEARALHLDRTDHALQATLRGRPAHAEAWLLLAGTRAARGEASAPELARHAATLDPQRPDLQKAAQALSR